MARFFKRLILFVILIVAIDFVVGTGLDYVRQHAKGGPTRQTHFMVDSMHSDILIMGSSRAVSHYVPNIIGDSTGFSCYNCGKNGYGLIYSYGIGSLITERYKPKLIIFEIYPLYDFLFDNNANYLKPLQPYIGNKSIDSLFIDIAPTELIKCKSKLYCHNSVFAQEFIDFVRPKDIPQNGFWPLEGTVNYAPPTPEAPNDFPGLNPKKMSYWNRIIDSCQANNIKMLFIVSPMYGGKNPSEYIPFSNALKERGQTLHILLNDSTFIYRRELFNDHEHFNSGGAIEYTEYVLPLIREALN